MGTKIRLSELLLRAKLRKKGLLHTRFETIESYLKRGNEITALEPSFYQNPSQEFVPRYYIKSTTELL